MAEPSVYREITAVDVEMLRLRLEQAHSPRPWESATTCIYDGSQIGDVVVDEAEYATDAALVVAAVNALPTLEPDPHRSTQPIGGLHAAYPRLLAHLLRAPVIRPQGPVRRPLQPPEALGRRAGGHAARLPIPSADLLD